MNVLRALTVSTLRAFAMALVLLQPAYATTLVVSNNTDISNGNVSSPDALIASPGPDGISLREAILAVRGAAGPHTIQFTSSLAGQTITVTGRLDLYQDDVAIMGLADSSGRPAITIQSPTTSANVVLDVRGSRVSVRYLRFINIHQTYTITLFAGQLQFGGYYPQSLGGIEISDCEFDNSAWPGFHHNAIALSIDPAARNASIFHVTIARNAFANLTGDTDAVMVGNGGAGNVIHDITVADNRFTNATFPVELVHGGPATNSRIDNVVVTSNAFTNNDQAVSISAIGGDGKPSVGNVIDGTRITHNVFDGNRAAIVIITGVTNATGNVISNTTIDGNRFTATRQIPVNISPALGQDGQPATSGNLVDRTQLVGNVFSNNYGPAIFMNGGVTNAVGNALTNTTFTNNVIFGTQVNTGISISPGFSGGRQNRISGVSIVNNTIVGNVGSGIHVSDDYTGGGNVSSGIAVQNSIVSGNSLQDLVGLTPSQVSFSLFGSPVLIGGIGNISRDPRFVNSAQGDFHLQPGSPAIDAANGAAAPLTDLEGNRRIDDPGSPNRGNGLIPYVDIGAYEYGGAPAAPTTVSVAASGAITKRTIGLSVTPPAAVQSQMGSVFVVAVLPPAQGSRVYAMAANLGWGAVTSCDSAPDAYSGSLRAGLQIPVIPDGADLSQVQGAVIQVGYGIGSTPAAACADMLNYSTITAVYTIH